MVCPSPTSPPFSTDFATSWHQKAQGEQSRLSEGTQWGVATHWRMLGSGCGADVPHEPRGFPGMVDGGHQDSALPLL